jgi:hypothetical protein
MRGQRERNIVSIYCRLVSEFHLFGELLKVRIIRTLEDIAFDFVECFYDLLDQTDELLDFGRILLELLFRSQRVMARRQVKATMIRPAIQANLHRFERMNIITKQFRMSPSMFDSDRMHDVR